MIIHKFKDHVKEMHIMRKKKKKRTLMIFVHSTNKYGTTTNL